MTNHFDPASVDYEQALAHNLRHIPGGIDHYYANRARIAANAVSDPSATCRVLDFGGGIGLAYKHLRRQFPNAEISIFDTSADSVRRALASNEGLRAVSPEIFDDLGCDLVFVAGVVHHVAAAERQQLIHTLSRCTKRNGRIAIFELNPLNPVTRRLVRLCPFDSDADLLSRGKLRHLVRQVPGIRVESTGFTVFFPPAFRFLLKFERYLRWLPLGAQYYIVLTKISDQ